MARKLRVFSTPAGFFNAVVAAPSQKAALKAWGVRENLFASGSASVVEDAALIAQALTVPGQIIRVPIGSEAEILKAAKPPPKASVGSAQARSFKRKAQAKRPRRPPPPLPDRTALDAADAALAEVEKRQARELKRLDDGLRRLEAERAAAAKALEKEVSSARSAREHAAWRYEAAGGKDPT